MPIKQIAIACQGGGSHAAYTAGALQALLPRFENAGIARSGGKRSAMQDDDAEHLNLAGISGTSGGAISALLGWFAYLTGGPQAAQERLAAFWDANCARQPGELILNESAQWMGRLLSVDLKFSPYLTPLREAENFTTGAWPSMTALWPPLGSWVRGQFFQLREEIAAQVDFELVAAIGDFCSIPLEAKRWQACALEARMSDPSAPALQARRLAIEDRISRKIATARRLAGWLERGGLEPDCPLRAAFGAWKEPDWGFDYGALDRLAAAVEEVSYTIPQLLLGAVDIDSGAFIAFSSERSAEDTGVSLDAVAASACLPWLFRAQEVRRIDPDTQQARTTSCWDGLFSQNPPIRNFVSDIADADKKPDGVWILQINRDSADAGPQAKEGRALEHYGSELWHRRDTLSGNLSLTQEIAFIEAINRRLDDPDDAGHAQDKPIEVARIVMDGAAVGAAAGRELGAFSKFDRNLALKDALVAQGSAQASGFLALRDQRNRLCEELGHQLENMGARPGRGRARAAAWRPGRVFGGLLSADVLTLDGAPGAHPDRPAPAALTWHVSDAVVEGRVVGIRGSSSLHADGEGWRLGETRLLDVREKVGTAPAALAQAARFHLPTGTERRRGAAQRPTLH